MKRYKLLKDLPFAKAGEEFQLHRGGINDYITLYRNKEQIYQFKVGENVSEMFNEWFEEVKELELPKEFFFVLINKIVSVNYLAYSFDEETKQEYRNIVEKHKSVGNFFETREEAESYLDFLKAKEVIKQDTKGFKPNWQDTDEDKWCGVWDIIHKEVSTHITWYGQEYSVYFKSKEDVEKSFEKHPNEWRTYLTYEQ